MPSESNLTNQLLDILEDLLIENSAYKSSVKVLEQFLPAQVRGRTDLVIAEAKADPHIRKTVQERFAPWRDQALDKAIEEILKVFPPSKDVN